MPNSRPEPDWDRLDCEPWEQLPKEAGKSFAAFAAYRNLDPTARSLRSLAQQLDMSLTNIGQLSARWWWQERCRRWDIHLDRIARHELEEARRETAKFHADLSRQTLQKVAQRLLGDEANGIEAIDLNKMSASELIRWLEVGTKVERTSRGEPDQKVELSGPEGGPIEVEAEPDPQVSQALTSLLEAARAQPEEEPAKKPAKKPVKKKAPAKKKTAAKKPVKKAAAKK